MNFRNLEKGTSVFSLEKNLSSKRVRHEFVDEKGFVWERYEFVDREFEVREFFFQGIYEPKLHLLDVEEIINHPETDWFMCTLETFIVLEDKETDLWEGYSEKDIEERKFYFSREEAEREGKKSL